MKKYILPALLIFIPFFGLKSNAQTPAKPQTKKILILGGYAHLGNGKVIESSAIAFENGKLTLVADTKTVRIDQSTYDEVIDAKGKHIYPGFIAPNSTLGITEIGAVRATRDFDDVGSFNPHVRALIAFNLESKIIPTVRTNGVLLSQVTPRGGIISGTSSIMELDGWNWEDAVHKTDDGIHLNWPSMFKRTGWWAEPGPIEKSKNQAKKIAEIHTFFTNAKAYSAQKGVEKNLRFEAMKGVFDGSKNVYVHVNFVKEIIQAVEELKILSVKNIVIVGGYDAWKVTDMLKENNVSVMIKRVHSLPQREDDDIDMSFKLPYLLQKSGVSFCLQNEGDMEAMNTRNLPFLAGTARAYGLTTEQAVAAISLNAAKILGVDATVGSIEAGKDATLFISEGDALDMRTNELTHAFIKGKLIDLNNKQKDLYQKYTEKYTPTD